MDAVSHRAKKVIRQIDSGESTFFDLDSDPGESRHLPIEDPISTRIEARLDRRVSELERVRYKPDSVEPTYSVKEQLEALGYLGGN